MLEELNISVPVALHLDHGSYEGCYKCIEAGFSSIMFDVSHYPIEENVEKTKELVNQGKNAVFSVFETIEEAKQYADKTRVKELLVVGE